MTDEQKIQADELLKNPLVLEFEAEVQRLRKEIDAAWDYIGNGYDIESREWFEAEAPRCGMYPLQLALHHLWKREYRG